MFEENDDNDNEFSNDNFLSDEEDVTELNIDDDDKESGGEDFKLLTYKNVIENSNNDLYKSNSLKIKN
jgi:hypothetical protein